MYYTIYETINKLNGKKYIGKHITNDPNDSYLGSGTYLNNAIQKYGKENFEKKLLHIFDNEFDMNKREEELVNEKIVLNENYYNISLGGQGGVTVLFKNHPEYTNVCNKIKTVQKSRSKQISETVKELHKHKKVGMYGKKQSENQKKFMSEKFKGIKKNPESVIKQKQSLKETLNDPNYIHPNKNKKYDVERLKRMSEETKSRPKKLCSYCNKLIDPGNYGRYHGEKCKLKYEDSE